MDVEVPRGGLALWVRVTKSFDNRPKPFIRLAFASPTEEELSRAVSRLVRSLPGPGAAI